MKKLEKIKALYKKVKNKKEFIMGIAEHYGISAQYVRTHYFTSFWAIPEDRMDFIIEKMKENINSKKEALT